MSKRCELQKEYYKEKGNYKGTGKYSDDYVKYLEDKLLAQSELNNTVDLGSVSKSVCDLSQDFQKYLKEQGETNCPQCGNKLIEN